MHPVRLVYLLIGHLCDILSGYHEWVGWTNPCLFHGEARHKSCRVTVGCGRDTNLGHLGPELLRGRRDELLRGGEMSVSCC